MRQLLRAKVLQTPTSVVARIISGTHFLPHKTQGLNHKNSKEDYKHRYKMRSLRKADEIQTHFHTSSHKLHIGEWSKPVMIGHVTVGTRPCETGSRQDGCESRLVDIPIPRRNVYHRVLPTLLVGTFANAQPPDSPLEPLGVPRHRRVLDLPAGQVAERDMPRRRSVHAQVAVVNVVVPPPAGPSSS